MAAAIESTGRSSSENILTEVRKFLRGASNERPMGRESHTKSALYLLQTLPTARFAVLEHLCSVFDEAVSEHLMQLMLNNSENPVDENRGHLDGVIQDACGVLFNFIKTGPQAWAPIISSWSLELLGQISQKYASHRVVPHANSLNELLQLWMTCTPTKSLMEVATECFAAMIQGAPDTCVDALLEASVKYSPHFDWVVAHIGSCFPDTIITRVLMCGLKDFCHNGGRSADMEMMSEERIPKMASVVGILGHLASKHSQEIRQALMKLFEDSLNTNSDTLKVTTVPFLLQLASMSPMLLQILTTDLIQALTPSVLNKLSSQFANWKGSSSHEYESFLTLVIHLITMIDVGSYQVLQFFLNMAEPREKPGVEAPNTEVQQTCAVLLNRLVTELQRAVFHRHRDGKSDVPLLASLTPQAILITEMLLNSQGQKAECLVKLLSFVGLYNGEDCTAEILAYIITESKEWHQLKRFLELQLVKEVRLGDILGRTTCKLMAYLQPPIVYCPQRLLKNVLILLQRESKTENNSVIRSTLLFYMRENWESLIPLLSHTDLTVTMTTLKILEIVCLTRPMSSVSAIRVSSALIIVFFKSLELTDPHEAQLSVRVCKQCLHQLCHHSFTQCILLRFLLEGLTNRDTSFLFGAKRRTSDQTQHRDQHPKVSLLEENSKLGTTLTLPRSQSSVFHAGIIGSGLRSRSSGTGLLQEHVKRNKRCLLDILHTCSRQNFHHNVDVAMETDAVHSVPLRAKVRPLTLSGDLCRMIGSLVTELTTPDVLYNNRFWPEEDSLRFTVERDLYVWKVFEENPVLWDVIELFSGNSLAMCRCSPVLKSLVAALMNHFECSRLPHANDTPKQNESACRLIHCLSRSLLLPDPLKYVSELFALVTSYEAYLILLAVWKYMKENPPTEDPEEAKRRVCETRHTDVVRAILHSNIDKMGHLFFRFFKE
ncbi:integrator complex subunit 5-like [Mizuhopecten yessoensis]|uniref:Integrator complex subunit 5 n=1 Tax=Mizuhopecten yessoensis TaxID=6573 RepID=A0A210Q7U0_MIZYE|nr:integrator complex subunit 5-like [Mizuhopecten yessoensis]OWF44790.1 Integrator complex subunit 5 [Mizuhopecten yessoensis]